MGLLEETLGSDTSAESDLGRGSVVLLLGWVDVHRVHLAAASNAAEHLEVAQVGRCTFDPDAGVHVVRQVGHLVGGGAHGAQVVAVGVARGIPIGMIEESRWPEWLHALGLDLAHLANHGDRIESFAWLNCDVVHSREGHHTVASCEVVHFRGGHYTVASYEVVHFRGAHYSVANCGEVVHFRGAHPSDGHLKRPAPNLRRQRANGAQFSKSHLKGPHLRCLWARWIGLAELCYAARGDGRGIGQCDTHGAVGGCVGAHVGCVVYGPCPALWGWLASFEIPSYALSKVWVDEQTGVADGWVAGGDPKIAKAWSGGWGYVGRRGVLWDSRQATQAEWTEGIQDAVHVEGEVILRTVKLRLRRLSYRVARQ